MIDITPKIFFLYEAFSLVVGFLIGFIVARWRR